MAARTVRVAHLGDLHIGLRDRQTQVERSLAFILEDLERLRPDLIVQAGDIFDTRSSISDRNVLAGWLSAIARNAPFFAIRGNHDVPFDLSIYNHLATPHHMQICEAPAVLDAAGLDVLALPHLDLKGLAADVSLEDGHRDSEARLRAILADFRAVAGHARAAILLAHADVAGRKLSWGEKQHQQGIKLTVADLLSSGADAVMLGHIHQLQSLDPRVWYAGSIARSNWGEADDEKGYLLWTLGAKGELPQVEVRNIPTRPMVTVSCSWSEQDGWRTSIETRLRSEASAQRGSSLEKPEAIADDAEVRVRISAPEARMAEAVQARADALDRWPDAKVEIQPEASSRIRCEDIAQAESLQEMLEAYWSTVREPPDGFKLQVIAALAELERLAAA